MFRKGIIAVFLILMAGSAHAQLSKPAYRNDGLWYKKAALYSILTIGLGGIAAFLTIPVIRKTIFKNPTQQTVSELLPFERILDDQVTLQTKDGSLHQLIVIPGIDYSGKTTNDEEAIFLSRYAFFKTVAGQGTTFKIISLRERVHKTAYAEYENPVLQEIHNRWMKNFERSFINTTYVLISSKSKIKNGKNLEVAYRQLRESVEGILNLLHKFRASVVSNNTEGKFSNLLTIYSKLVNGWARPIQPFTSLLSERLPESTIIFNQKPGLIQYRQGNKELFGRFITVKSWGDEANEKIMRRLLSLPGEIQICQSIKGYTKEEAVGGSTKKLQAVLLGRKKQKTMLFAWTFTKVAFEKAIQHVGGEREACMEYDLTILVQDDTEEQVDQLISRIKEIFADYGITGVLEEAACEYLWFSRFPSYTFQIQPRLLLSSPVGVLNPFDQELHGLERCDWGEGPLRYFKTSAGNAYSLQLHSSDRPEALAHSVTFAPSDSGKTVLALHLIGGALRHKNLAAYAFDRYNGIKIFTKAVGGEYLDVADGSLQLNPLHLPDTLENRSFLKSFLLQLAQENDNDSVAGAERAVAAIYATKRSERSLKSVFDSVFDQKSKLRAGMQRWIANDSIGRWFNGKHDSLNLENSRLIAFDMTEILNDERASAAYVTYVLHQIRSVCRREGKPHLILIDETAPMLKDPAFRNGVEVLYREHRKLRGSINTVFQDVGALLRSGAKETILTNSETYFVFPNPNAVIEDYRELNLTEAEMNFVKNPTSTVRFMKRSVLVKRRSESVILDVDLSSLGEYLRLYRSGTQAVIEANKLINQYGDREWVAHYLKESS